MQPTASPPDPSSVYAVAVPFPLCPPQLKKERTRPFDSQHQDPPRQWAVSWPSRNAARTTTTMHEQALRPQLPTVPFRSAPNRTSCGECQRLRHRPSASGISTLNLSGPCGQRLDGGEEVLAPGLHAAYTRPAVPGSTHAVGAPIIDSWVNLPYRSSSETVWGQRTGLKSVARSTSVVRAPVSTFSIAQFACESPCSSGSPVAEVRVISRPPSADAPVYEHASVGGRHWPCVRRVYFLASSS
jgi:hypothetical protein